jgi:hypothetical protein
LCSYIFAPIFLPFSFRAVFLIFSHVEEICRDTMCVRPQAILRAGHCQCAPGNGGEALAMNFVHFGKVPIFRPSDETEAVVRQLAKAHLLGRFDPGLYRGAQAANAVIEHQFQFFESLLQPLIPEIACRETAEFLLFQFDQAVSLLLGQNIPDPQERESWMAIEPVFRRAIKYLVELLCAHCSSSAGAALEHLETLDPLETALLCAERTMGLARQSDLVCSVFPEECIVRVHEEGFYDWEIRIEGKHDGCDMAFKERVERDVQGRTRFVDFPPFDKHTIQHEGFLDDAFKESFGMGYGSFIACLMSVIDDALSSQEPNALPTLFLRRGGVIDAIATIGKPRTGVERALDGFSVTAAQLLAEGGVVWKAKQEYRAFRRGFFVFPGQGGPHLAFSREMAREHLIELVKRICYKQLPSEWRTSGTSKALAHLSHAAMNWFEKVVLRNLKALGMVGQRRQATIGGTGRPIQIPNSMGELHFFGYQPQEKLLVLMDYKMVRSGLEPAEWREDVQRFILGPDSYAEHFRRKLAWAKGNLPALAAAVGCPAATKLGAAMLTLYPCIAGTIIDDFPCVSITEFMLDYEEKSQWPYQVL